MFSLKVPQNIDAKLLGHETLENDYIQTAAAMNAESNNIVE